MLNIRYKIIGFAGCDQRDHWKIITQTCLEDRVTDHDQGNS